MKHYEIRRIFEGGWLLYETEETVCMYLVCGSSCAALIDAGMGTGDLLSEIRELTDLPILPLLTHGHPDHYLGAIACPYVYLDERDHALMRHYEAMDAAEGLIPGGFRPELRPLPESFDLGGRTLRTVNLQGHTPGSTGFLLEEERVLFSGDGLIYNVWMQLDESSTLQEYRSVLEKLRTLQPRFDAIWTGHAQDALPPEHLDRVLRLLDRVLEAPFGIPNPPDEPPGRIADGENCRITYDPHKIYMK